MKTMLRNIGIKNILGFTATPIYMENSMKGSVLKIMCRTKAPMFRDICHVIQIDEMIKNKRWSELEYVEYEFDSKGLILNSSGSDYTEQSILTNYTETNTEVKVLNIVKTLGNERFLAFVPGIENVNSLVEHLSKSGLKVGFVHSKMSMKDRTETLKLFKNGEIQGLINCIALLAGYDDPTLPHLIDAYPTNSARVNYQKIGRIVRTGKKTGTVHCISGNYSKFGSIKDITFEKAKNYGWGMFVKGYLLSGVPMKENIKITKQDLEQDKPKKSTKGIYDFEYQGDLSTDVISFGRYKGYTVDQLYKKDKGYLNWMYKMIKEQNSFRDRKNRKIRSKIIELFDKSLPF